MLISAESAKALFDFGESGDTYINAAGRSPLLRSSYVAACEAVAMKVRRMMMP